MFTKESYEHFFGYGRNISDLSTEFTVYTKCQIAESFKRKCYFLTLSASYRNRRKIAKEIHYHIWPPNPIKWFSHDH